MGMAQHGTVAKTVGGRLANSHLPTDPLLATVTVSACLPASPQTRGPRPHTTRQGAPGGGPWIGAILGLGAKQAGTKVLGVVFVPEVLL